MAKNLLLIHGAWSGTNSFNYISDNVGIAANEILYFRYNAVKDSLKKIINDGRDFLAEETKDFVVVGHSLGGLIALSLHNMEHCSHIITLASPLSGIKLSPLVQTFTYNRAPILQEISPGSTLIKSLQSKEYKKKIDIIITKVGFNPAILEPSDGVITVETQERWIPQSAVSTYIDCNHYEILQSKQAVATIRRALV